MACALANNPLTEDHNLWLDQQSDAATRRVITEFARRLVEPGSLERAEDIEYLTLYELMQWGFALANPLLSLITSFAVGGRNRVFSLKIATSWSEPGLLMG